jgi:[calcium/calmodulin-dependent protein kinase] kinase
VEVEPLKTARCRQASGGAKKIQYSAVHYEVAPYGDFCDLLNSDHLPKDEMLARTYFRQLVEGLEYLHYKQQMAHLDIKMENLLMGKGYTLKISDFDSCHSKSDGRGSASIIGQGTEDYRAPEILNVCCSNPKAADVFSAGICLFVLLTQGKPYNEGDAKEKNLMELLLNDVETFWKVHERVFGQTNFSNDFKKLFEGMTNQHVSQRLTIKEVKKSAWYKGPIYTQEQLQALLKNMPEVL